jgi:hypothetical protein
MHAHLRPQMAPQPLVPALGQKVQVQRPERRPEPERIIGLHHGAIRIGRLQTVVRDIRPLHRPGEQPRRVHVVHPDPLPAGQDDHAGSVGPPPADHHMVPPRMRTQHMVRIVMLARDQALDIRALDHYAEVSQ